MSKRCDIECRECGESTDMGWNWGHRKLHHILEITNAETLDAAELLASAGVLFTGNEGRALDFVLAHRAHHWRLRVVDEYGAEWPCACGGSHTGPCNA